MTIDIHLLEDIENPNHPSNFVAVDGYSVLILRLPEILQNKIDVKSYAFVIDKNKCFSFDREKNSLAQIGTLEGLENFLDDKTEKLIKDIQKYHFNIENLEESLYEERLNNMFMQKWLSYKKDVSLIYRFMFHASLSFELFIAHHKRDTEFNDLAFADVYEHMIRIRDLSKDAMDKLDNLYDFYRAKVDEKMNKNVYYLTIISGIFLPLTLLTGFFGMNTGGLPLSNDPNGTMKMIIFSFVLELLFILPFFLQNIQKIKKFHPKR